MTDLPPHLRARRQMKVQTEAMALVWHAVNGTKVAIVTTDETFVDDVVREALRFVRDVLAADAVEAIANEEWLRAHLVAPSATVDAEREEPS